MLRNGKDKSLYWAEGNCHNQHGQSCFNVNINSFVGANKKKAQGKVSYHFHSSEIPLKFSIKVTDHFCSENIQP